MIIARVNHNINVYFLTRLIFELYNGKIAFNLASIGGLLFNKKKRLRNKEKICQFWDT